MNPGIRSLVAGAALAATLLGPTLARAADIVDTAVAAGSFNTLVTAVKAAGLVKTLKGKGPYTVFAPNDAAFAKLPPGTVESLLKNKAKLATILKYHVVPGRVKAADVAGAHAADVAIQGQYDVNYKQYWVDEENGKVFCLVDAPDRDTATRVHREAHGLEAHTLYEVSEGG